MNQTYECANCHAEVTIDVEYSVVPSVDLTTREDARVAQWRVDIAKMLDYAKTAEVTDLDSARMATNDMTCIASLEREIEDTRKAYKAPVLEAGRTIDAFFALLSDDLKAARLEYQKKIAAYHAAQEKARKEAEEVNQMAGVQVVDQPDPQRRVRAEMGTVTFMAQVDKEKVQAAIDAAAHLFPDRFPLSIPGLHIYPVWTFKVLDVKQVPEEYRKVGTRVNRIGG